MPGCGWRLSLLLMTSAARACTRDRRAAAIQAEFGVDRGDASLPYTLTMIGFGLGGILMGRLADRFGVVLPVVHRRGGPGRRLHRAPGWRPASGGFCLAQGLLIGLLGTSATFAPLVADTSQWFDRRRGIALAICMSGNYAAGAVWPPVLQHFIDAVGWRQTYVGMGVFCLATMLPLALVLRPRPPRAAPATAGGRVRRRRPPRQPSRPMGLRPGTAAGAAVRRRRRRAAWRCRCRRCTSSPTAATSASAPRAAPRCCR